MQVPFVEGSNVLEDPGGGGHIRLMVYRMRMKMAQGRERKAGGGRQNFYCSPKNEAEDGRTEENKSGLGYLREGVGMEGVNLGWQWKHVGIG